MLKIQDYVLREFDRAEAVYILYLIVFIVIHNYKFMYIYIYFCIKRRVGLTEPTLQHWGAVYTVQVPMAIGLISMSGL